MDIKGVFLWYLLFSVGFKIPFFWYCLPEMVGLDGLRNLLLRELEDFADFERILVLMCFLGDNLAWEARSQVGVYKTFQKRQAHSFGNGKLRLQSLLVLEFSCCLPKTGTK